MLIEIGFWCQAGDAAAAASDPERPDPRRLVDDAWASALLSDAVSRQRLEWYLTRGAFVESHELAYSYCRFPDCSEALEDPKVMGACTLTDGAFCWPEAYWHYVSCHHVKPPTEFLQHVDANFARLEETRGGESGLLLWDEIEQQAAPMPRAMQEWITAHTTLQSV